MRLLAAVLVAAVCCSHVVGDEAGFVPCDCAHACDSGGGVLSVSPK